MTAPKNRDELDELRARTLWGLDEDKVDPAEPWEDCPETWKNEYREAARVLREADEAAGVVPVPSKCTEEMIIAHNGKTKNYAQIDASTAASPYGKDK